MNNATRQDSIRPYTVPQHDHDQDDPVNLHREGSFNSVEQKEISEVLRRLDQIRFTPRAATIRAIMKYAHERNKAVH